MSSLLGGVGGVGGGKFTATDLTAKMSELNSTLSGLPAAISALNEQDGLDAASVAGALAEFSTLFAAFAALGMALNTVGGGAAGGAASGSAPVDAATSAAASDALSQVVTPVLNMMSGAQVHMAAPNQ